MENVVQFFKHPAFGSEKETFNANRYLRNSCLFFIEINSIQWSSDRVYSEGSILIDLAKGRCATVLNVWVNNCWLDANRTQIDGIYRDRFTTFSIEKTEDSSTTDSSGSESVDAEKRTSHSFPIKWTRWIATEEWNVLLTGATIMRSSSSVLRHHAFLMNELLIWNSLKYPAQPLAPNRVASFVEICLWILWCSAPTEFYSECEPKLKPWNSCNALLVRECWNQETRGSFGVNE